MGVNGITGTNPYAAAAYQKAQEKPKKEQTEKTADDTAVVYEKSNNNVVSGSIDTDTVNRLQAELKYKQQQFAGLVEKLLGKQGKKSNDLMDLLKGLKNGTIKVDDATAAQAQKEIGEDGYWGVEQTSNRLVEMAKALSGNDPEKADAMIAAMEKGFKQATKAFGDDLPSICRDTVDAATKKLNDWKASFNSTTETVATEE